MKEFKVIIAGSRDFSDYLFLKEKCDLVLSNKRIDHNITILCGLAKGADKLGEKYGHERDYTVDYFPALWNKNGKAAGFIRNAEMADQADAGILFDLGTKGTAHMASLLHKKNIPYKHYKFQ